MQPLMGCTLLLSLFVCVQCDYQPGQHVEGTAPCRCSPCGFAAGLMSFGSLQACASQPFVATFPSTHIRTQAVCLCFWQRIALRMPAQGKRPGWQVRLRHDLNAYPFITVSAIMTTGPCAAQVHVARQAVRDEFHPSHPSRSALHISELLR